MTNAAVATRPRSSIRFRGRSFLAIVLTPEMPVDGWLADLDAWLGRTPSFLAGKPLVVDVSELTIDKDEFRWLIAELKARKVSILGVEGAKPSWLGDGFPPLLTGGRTSGDIDVSELPQAAPEPVSEPVPVPQLAPSAPPKPAATLLVEAALRSGQSIVHPDGDVTVLGSVASGAEIVAGGSIHVYGTLRGRALAGMYGNTRARIFCRRLDAELIAIDGFYKVADEIEPALSKKAVHAWLEGGQVKIKILD